MLPKPHLVIFLRMPQLGRVKTRLARDIGALAALQFYRITVTRLLHRLGRDRRWHLTLAVTPDHGTLPHGWDRAARLTPQGTGDLGHRMGRIFRTMPPGPVVIVGSDIPAVTPDHIAAAFCALGRSDAVVGPAADGGYWLIGLRRSRRVPAALFAKVRWSSEHALADTLAGLPRGFSVARLATLEDIDDGAAYARWRYRRCS